MRGDVRGHFVVPLAIVGVGLLGDLDAIVAKALAKAPRERYSTIAELTADLRAWRDGRPVSAAPQSVAYRARRFVRRHRGTVAAGIAITVAVIAGATATAWQAHVAARERDKAQNRFRQVREFSRSLLFDVHKALRPVPGATEARRRLLLSRAVQFLDGLAADAGNDDALKFELAEGYRRLGSVQVGGSTENVGDVAASVASFQKAATLAEEAMRADPRAHERPFGARVLRRETVLSGARRARARLPFSHQHRRDIKIEQLRLPLVGHQNVRRLDVAMDDEVLVRVGQRAHAFDERHALAQAQAARAAPVVDALAVDQLHHEIREPVGRGAGIEQSRDAGVIEVRQHLALEAEALGERRAARCRQNLDRGAPIVNCASPTTALARTSQSNSSVTVSVTSIDPYADIFPGASGVCA